MNQNKISPRQGTAGLYKKRSERDIGQITSRNSNSPQEAQSYPLWCVHRAFYFIYSFPILDLLSHSGYDNKIESGREKRYFLSSQVQKEPQLKPALGAKKAGRGFTRDQAFAQLKANRRLMGFKSLLPKHPFSYPKLRWLPGTGSSCLSKTGCQGCVFFKNPFDLLNTNLDAGRIRQFGPCLQQEGKIVNRRVLKSTLKRSVSYIFAVGGTWIRFLQLFCKQFQQCNALDSPVAKQIK